MVNNMEGELQQTTMDPIPQVANIPRVATDIRICPGGVLLQ